MGQVGEYNGQETGNVPHHSLWASPLGHLPSLRSHTPRCHHRGGLAAAPQTPSKNSPAPDKLMRED